MAEEFNNVHEEIMQWLKALRFRKKLFGGIDEEEVLKKIEELNVLYEKALIYERARYDTLLKERGGGTVDEN